MLRFTPQAERAALSRAAVRTRIAAERAKRKRLETLGGHAEDDADANDAQSHHATRSLLASGQSVLGHRAIADVSEHVQFVDDDFDERVDIVDAQSVDLRAVLADRAVTFDADRNLADLVPRFQLVFPGMRICTFSNVHYSSSTCREALKRCIFRCRICSCLRCCHSGAGHRRGSTKRSAVSDCELHLGSV